VQVPAEGNAAPMRFPAAALEVLPASGVHH
jgi:hypothetical protein